VHGTYRLQYAIRGQARGHKEDEKSSDRKEKVNKERKKTHRMRRRGQRQRRLLERASDYREGSYKQGSEIKARRNMSKYEGGQRDAIDLTL